jgi:hypothetical protein
VISFLIELYVLVLVVFLILFHLHQLVSEPNNLKLLLIVCCNPMLIYLLCVIK